MASLTKELTMEKSDKQEYFCRICGYHCNFSLWVTPKTSSHELCPSCGNHPGEDDCNLEDARSYRKEWLESGPEWWDGGSYPPKDWDPIKQMENIPPEWR